LHFFQSNLTTYFCPFSI